MIYQILENTDKQIRHLIFRTGAPKVITCFIPFSPFKYGGPIHKMSKWLKFKKIFFITVKRLSIDWKKRYQEFLVTHFKSIYIIHQKILQIFSEYGVLKFGQDNWYCITKNFFKTTTIYFISNRLINNWTCLIETMFILSPIVNLKFYSEKCTVIFF